jgi:sulfur carrier protein ThiS
MLLPSGSMNVKVRLYAELARSLPGGERQRTIELPIGSSVGDLLTALALPPEQGIIVGLNGKLADRSAALSEGDELELMTAMQGGDL